MFSRISLDYIRQLLQAAPYILALSFIKIIPASFAQKIFQAVADKLANKPGVTCKLRDNLAQVLDTTPEQVPQSLIVAAMRSYMRYWMEACRLPVMDKSYIHTHTEMIHWDHAEADVISDKGVIFVLPHSGNWDMAGVWYLTQYADTLYTVNERVKPELLYQKFVRYRESLGFTILPHDAHPFDILAQQLARGGTVCLLVDRIVGEKKNQLKHNPDELQGENNNSASQNGITSKSTVLHQRDLAAFTQVNFFHKPVWVTTGPIRLAAETQASLFAAYPSFTPQGWKITISPAINFSMGNKLAMQEIMDFFAENIREKPEDWHALQRIWKNTP